MTRSLELRPVQIIVPSSEFQAQRPEYAYFNQSLSETDLQALDHFEKAVDLEHNGRFGDAVSLYRRAYNQNDKVDRLYREKYYSSKAKVQEIEKNMNELVLSEQENDNDSQQEITGPSPISDSPSEILIRISEHVALVDSTALVSLLCINRRFYELGISSESIWKALCVKTYSAQKYSSHVQESLDLAGIDEVVESHYKNSYRHMFKNRPFIRFNGIYISTCTYLRHGLSSGWNNPVHMVTYYRYLRFFEDGTCMSLLTVLSPPDVVPVFFRENPDKPPIICYREDATIIHKPRNIVEGSWQLSDIDNGGLDMELPGPVERYTFYMKMQIASSGTRRHNKLKWVQFWGINKETGNQSDFGLKHDKAYYFVRTAR